MVMDFTHTHAISRYQSQIDEYYKNRQQICSIYLDSDQYVYKITYNSETQEYELYILNEVIELYYADPHYVCENLYDTVSYMKNEYMDNTEPLFYSCHCFGKNNLKTIKNCFAKIKGLKLNGREFLFPHPKPTYRFDIQQIS